MYERILQAIERHDTLNRRISDVQAMLALPADAKFMLVSPQINGREITMPAVGAREFLSSELTRLSANRDALKDKLDAILLTL